MENVYVYIRFSDDKQAQGSSYERQLGLARNYCASLIEDKAHIFFDAGKSAFTGANVREGGELKRFYDGVESGGIPRGSTLLVEDLDRLSRAGMWKASDKLRDLTENGITVVTLRDQHTYTGKLTLSSSLTALIKQELAHEESAKKSERVAHSWKKRAQEARAGERIKLPLASWLAYDPTNNSKYILVRERAEVVKRMFALCKEGRGTIAIAKLLNEEGMKPFRGSRWSNATVYSVLKNTATIGTYTPDKNKGVEHRSAAVEDFFPPVIDKATFYEVQAILGERKNTKVTRQSSIFNVWAGIAKCSVCFGTLHCVPKGRNNQRYLVCSNKIAGKCTKAKNVRNDDGELAFRELLAKVESESLYTEDKAVDQKLLRELEGRIAEQRKQHSELGLALDRRYTPQLDDLAYAAGERLKQLEEAHNDMLERLSKERLRQDDKAWLIEQLSAVLVSYEQRAKANALLKRLGIYVVVQGGQEPVFVARRPEELWIPGTPEHPDRILMNTHSSFLQLVVRKNGVVLVPIKADQRTKFREQDKTGEDSARFDDWFNSLGLFSKKAV
ncbi:recombinase family protein [Massilia putida]|uniref:recombinase family protein n=1 Tax=Massilia putida TaxID=1141883 RepID=UPI0014739704|nr:recombinase family protein [Massilia putida]